MPQGLHVRVSAFPELDSRLLTAALTCRSAYQATDLCSATEQWHSQRLEFLGDAVLGFVVSLYLFCCSRKGDTEETLTNRRTQWVSNRHLTSRAKAHNLAAYILARPFVPSAGLCRLRLQQVSPKMQADAVEALIACFYLSNASLLSRQQPSKGPENPGASIYIEGHLPKRGSPLRSFEGLVAAAAFIGRFILEEGAQSSPSNAEGEVLLGAPQQMTAQRSDEKMPPAVNVLTAAAGISERMCGLSSDGPCGNPKERDPKREEGPLDSIPLAVGVKHEPLLPNAKVTALLHQLMGPFCGGGVGSLFSKAEEQEGGSLPLSSRFLLGTEGSALRASLGQEKASHKAVEGMWLQAARQRPRAASECFIDSREATEPERPKDTATEICTSERDGRETDREADTKAKSKTFWRGRGLHPRLVALGRTAQVPALGLRV